MDRFRVVGSDDMKLPAVELRSVSGRDYCLACGLGVVRPHNNGLEHCSHSSVGRTVADVSAPVLDLPRCPPSAVEACRSPVAGIRVTKLEDGPNVRPTTRGDKSGTGGSPRCSAFLTHEQSASGCPQNRSADISVVVIHVPCCRPLNGSTTARPAQLSLFDRQHDSAREPDPPMGRPGGRSPRPRCRVDLFPVSADVNSGLLLLGRH